MASGKQGRLQNIPLLLGKHSQKPSDCFLVLGSLHTLPLGKAVVLLRKTGFASPALDADHLPRLCLLFFVSAPHLSPMSVGFIVRPSCMLSMAPLLQSCGLGQAGGSCGLQIPLCASASAPWGGKICTAEQELSTFPLLLFSFLTFHLVSSSYSWVMALLHSVGLWP